MLHSVSLPANTHFSEELNKNWSALAQAERFAIAPGAVMREDVAIINAHLAAGSDSPDVAVTHRPDDRCWELTVRGRTYRTHPPRRDTREGSSQLYPVCGPEVTHGSGAVALGRILRQRKALDETRSIRLESIARRQERGAAASAEPEQRAVAPAQLSKSARHLLATAFAARLDARGCRQRDGELDRMHASAVTPTRTAGDRGGPRRPPLGSPS